MKKLTTLTAAAAIVAMAGTTAFAQSNEAPAQPTQQEKADARKGNWQERRANMHRLAEARIAGIPAGLKLNADQQKLWQPVEAALKDNMQSRADSMSKMREMRAGSKERPDYMQRLEMRSEMAQLQARNSKNFLDAMKPFWASLDDGQKKLLPSLLQPGGSRMKNAQRGNGRGMYRGHMAD